MAKIEGKTLAIKAKVMRLRVRTSSSPDLIYYLQYFSSHMSSVRVFFFFFLWVRLRYLVLGGMPALHGN